MGDEFATSETEAETAPEIDLAAPPGPLPLPEGAQPVEGVAGYHALVKGGAVIVFGPDGTEIASATRRGYNEALVGRVGETRLVSDGIGDRRLTSFAALAARHHRAAADPGVRDRVWVRWEKDGVAAVYGTDKYDDDDRRAVKAGNLYWSGQRQGWATGRKWNPGTRDRNLAAVLLAFSRQDRNVVVLGPGQTPEDLTASPRTAATAAVPAQQAPSAAAAPTTVPEPEPEPEDFTSLSYEDLVEAQDAAAAERSQVYTTVVERRYKALRTEHGRRLLDRVATSTPVTELSNEDLAAESEWWQKTIYKTPFHSADESYRTLERRRDAVTVEQNGRTARTLLAGPAAADLDDEALESAYERIGPVWTRLPGGHELNEQVTDYRKSLKDERIARRARSYGERTPVGEMALEDLVAESADLGSTLAARNEQSAYSYSDAVKEARAKRLLAVEAEWERRGLEQHPDAARATLGTNLGGRRQVLIDGSERGYGYVERHGKKFRALAGWDERSSLGDFDSGPAAMAALVRRYDQDPETLPRRTWGNTREVDLPSSAYDPLVSWLRRRPSELSREHARVLDLLTPYAKPTQTKVLNPLTNQIMRAYPFYFEEGLLGELARIAERTTEDLREQSLNEQLPKREREAAKRRIPAMGAALIGINAVIEQVRAAGGDVERRGVDQGRLAAQMAALAGTVDEREGGESDGGEQPVRDAAAAALGGVPAPGAGGDAGPGDVLPDAGGADERGDRRGGGGPGGDAGAGDGVPGPGRADGADLGDGAGAGPARDAAAAGGRAGPGGAVESGSGGAGGDPQGAGEPVATRRFRPDPADLPRGPLARAEANLAAVKVLRTLERENRGTTVDEARTLARWSGWGSVPTVFLDEPDPDEPIYGPGGDREGAFETDHAAWESYSRVRGELRDLLDPFEWRAASRAVLSAHYTPQAVAESMWQGLAAYGFDGGEVLEAGCGSGAFFGVAPPAARLTGVELDPTTAAIAGRIYPHANVLAESFTDTDAPLGTFDAVIGNVPFAQAPFGERRYRAGGHSLHNGFIIKQLALLRPGAYMAVITSRWTLDGEDAAARRDMSRWGDLAAAYRLPKGTFGETADTDVVADVLVFRRRTEGEEPRDQGWIEAPERELGGNAVTVNAYFTEHPEHVLGRLTTETGPYGPRVTVQGDPGEAPRLLRERMEATAAAAVADGLGYVHHEDWPHREPLLLQTARLKHATDFTGRLYTDDHGRIWQHVNGADPVRVITADGVLGTEQLRTLLALRDVAGELQELDRTGQDPDRAREVRDQLARLHASYTAKHGPLSRPRQTRLALPTDEAAAAARDAGVNLDGEDRLPTGWGWFRQDPHAAVVLGLEHWDRANDRAVNSEVLTRRPGARRGDLEPTDDPKTALTAVMGATGRVDLPLIASLLGTTEDEARLRLGTEVFDNPVTKKLEHAGAYLSGAVREKLEQAREAAATDPKYAVNVAALEVVQPPPKRLGQFTAQLGAHWIPAPLVQGFLREYLGDPTLQVSHNERYGWSLAAGKVPDAINALKGTERRSALHIAKALLGKASMVVNLLDGSGVDEDATRAMRYKADAMRSAFEEYCTASTARVTQLTDAYNRQMNGHVVRSYDNLAPTLEGFTTERTPHPWQLSGAARMQFERGVILAHEMGLGKTTTMVMGSQALKASGQIGKPFAVVQPGLGRQWLDEAKLLYPNADIHLITSDDLADGNRRPVLEWLRANSPDLVIFTEGAFGSIRMSPEQQELYLFREIESLKEQLERERGVPHNAFALMKLEQRLATVEARIRRNDAPMRTPGEVYWDDLGFDYACIDEAHRFTAVGFRSKEAGGESASVRAVDLHQKLSWHHRMAEYDGGRPTVTLGTGTPTENSIFEQYSCLELATPWLLDQFGVHGPDLWSETFGQKVQRIEQAPDGSGLTIVERFSRFVSKSTMKTMWGLATDTKTGDEVGIERPQVAGGAPKLVLVEPTADQRTRLQSLVVRGQAIHAGDVTRDEDNMLAVSGEGRAVALDPRLVDANAPAGNKLVEAADIIAAGYHAHKDHTYAVSSRDDTPHPVPGGLFFVFANSGTPGGNNKGGFDAYAELRDLLAARGVPPDMVQFAQEHRTPERKAEMTRAANNGGIAVLMGSSEVLGTGFNGQNRAYALMHLDQDWTPAMMMQRNARALRPGNQHEEVDIYFLATKGSMDAWQVGLLTSKAEGLRDIQRPPGVGDDDGDTVEEIGASDWDYATMAAEIGGNPYMRQFMEAKIHLQGLEADRRNAAADRVRQMELLGTKEGELAGTRAAIAAREKALPKITETIRGDAFRIRIGGREFEKFGEAAPVLRQVVTEAVRAHQREGIGPWKKLGTFGGLDFAVQPEIAHGSGEVRAYVGFPELRHSESRCSVEDLVKGNIGATMLGRLATALEKAEDHQLMDRERLPGLEKEVAVLTAQQEAVNYGPAIEHARRRVELLDGIVGAITERDKIPELTESMLDPKKYPTENSRKKALQENAEKRAPHQANVDAAAARLAAFDAENPAPQPVQLINTWTEDNDTEEAFEQWREQQRIIVQQNREAGLGAPISADETTPTPEDGAVGTVLAASAPDAAAAEPTSTSGERTAGQAQEPEPDGDSTKELAAGTTEPPGDGYGTADLYDEFGLTQPERVPAPAPQGEPDPEAETDESAGVPDGQMTVEEVQPDPAPAEPPLSDDRWERLTSADGQLAFTLPRVPTDGEVHPDVVEGYLRRRDELAAAVETRNTQSGQSPQERDEQLAQWIRSYKTANGLEPWKPAPSLRLTPRPDAPGLKPAEYAIGSWVTWQDTATGTQVTGQVMSPGADTDTFYVSTDRTGVTGEYHVLSRSGKKKTGYSYSINGATTDLRPADGPPEPLAFESLPTVAAVPAHPVTSYAEHIPKDGMAPVREPVPVIVGPDEVRSQPAEVVFPVTADHIPFVVKVDHHDASAALLYTLRVEVDGETVAELWREETRAAAIDAAVRAARQARELADKPLYARSRNHTLDVAEDGVCAKCHRQFDGDTEAQPLYQVDGGDPTCAPHIASALDVRLGEVEELGAARRIMAARTAPELPTSTEPAVTTEPDTTEVTPATEPREVERGTVEPGNLITVVVSGRSIERSTPWEQAIPETISVTGTVFPGHRSYHQSTALIDAVIRDADGNELAAGEDLFVRQLPAQVHLTPAGHRDDLRPETRTVTQIRLGDLIAEGGRRGEVVTELRYAYNANRGYTGFQTRDVTSGNANGFTLPHADEVLVVPRERRPAEDVAAVFGSHISRAQATAETRRVHELHTALDEAASRQWPDGGGPQNELQALRDAIQTVDADGSGIDAYRSNAAAMDTAAAAATALFETADAAALYGGYLGEPLHQLRQHLDVQIHRLHADVARITQRRDAQAEPVPTPTTPEVDERATVQPTASPEPEQDAADEPRDGAGPDAPERQMTIDQVEPENDAPDVAPGDQAGEPDTTVAPSESAGPQQDGNGLVESADEAGPASSPGPLYKAHELVYHDGARYTVRGMSADGLTIETFANRDLPVAEVTHERDMPPVTSEELATGWWRYSYLDRTYTAVHLPDSIAGGRLATLSVAIVDEDGELVGRSFGRPSQVQIIWAHIHPGEPSPQVVNWLSLGPSPFPPYTEEERAYIQAGPLTAAQQNEQMALDLDDVEQDQPQVTPGPEQEGGAEQRGPSAAPPASVLLEESPSAAQDGTAVDNETEKETDRSAALDNALDADPADPEPEPSEEPEAGADEEPDYELLYPQELGQPLADPVPSREADPGPDQSIQPPSTREEFDSSAPGVAEAPELAEDSAALGETDETDDSVEPAAEQGAASSREGMTMAEEQPQESALPPIPEAPVLDPIDDGGTEAASVRADARADGLRALWSMGPAALGIPDNARDAVREALRQAGEQVAAEADQYRAQFAAAMGDILNNLMEEEEVAAEPLGDEILPEGPAVVEQRQMPEPSPAEQDSSEPEQETPEPETAAEAAPVVADEAEEADVEAEAAAVPEPAAEAEQAESASEQEPPAPEADGAATEEAAPAVDEEGEAQEVAAEAEAPDAPETTSTAEAAAPEAGEEARSVQVNDDATEQPAATPAEQDDPAVIAFPQIVAALEQLRQSVDAVADAQERQTELIAALSQGIAQLGAAVDPPDAPQPSPDLGLPGFEEVEQAYAAATQHGREFNGAREWKQLQALWQSSQKVWESARDVLRRSGARMADRVRGICRAVGIRVADGVARLSDRLADRLAKADRHGSPGHRALRWLSRAAQNGAARLRGHDPAEHFAAFDQITNSVRDLRADLVRGTDVDGERQNTSAGDRTPAAQDRDKDAFQLVNEAFGSAARHTREYNGAPEWRRLNAVVPVANRVLGEQRDAARARHGAALFTDAWWQDAFRTIGVRSLDTIARHAHRLAERLAQAGRYDSPGRQAIQDLGQTAQRAAATVRGDDVVVRAADLDRFNEALRDLQADLAQALGDGPDRSASAAVPFGEPSRPVLATSEAKQKAAARPDDRQERPVQPALSGGRGAGSGVGE